MKDRRRRLTCDGTPPTFFHVEYTAALRSLHDLQDPAKIKGVGDSWILQPDDPWEITGYVSNVVFTCGAVAESDGTVKIYWGGADSVMCAGEANIPDLVDLCLDHGRPAK